MSSPVETGYLVEPYLLEPYLAVHVDDFYGMGVRLVVQGQKPLGMQAKRFVTDYPTAQGMQVNRTSAGFRYTEGMEVTLRAEDVEPIGMQVLLNPTKTNASGMQVDRQTDGLSPFGMEVRRDHSLSIWGLGTYLVDPYLTTPYLVGVYGGQTGWQVHRQVIDRKAPYGMQVDRAIAKQRHYVMQVERVLNKERDVGMQVDRLRADPVGMQVRFVLYNTKLLRILCDFVSRGAVGSGGLNVFGNPKGTGLNWQASSTLAGDFDATNLNTDIEEQVWRSNGILSATLRFDTEVNQGVAIDTLALRNHNLTSSAVVVLQAFDDPGFSPALFTAAIQIYGIHAYYISPTFPLNQYRYWEISISDPTNPNPYLQVGCVLAGSAMIFQNETFIDRVTRRQKHFSDKVETEGFTNVSNDRALKRSVQLSFESLDFTKGNYAILSQIFEEDRTSQKCLWIPDPQKISRLTVFGKLTSIPDEEHRDYGLKADYVDLTLEVDESQ